MVPSSTVNSTELTSEPFLKYLRAEKAVETFLASVSGEWQVTASVTNESSVQLHLFDAPLWRAKHSSLFVKLRTAPQERSAREEIKHLQKPPELRATVINH